jgi:uncharacterized membrane protein YczE
MSEPVPAAAERVRPARRSGDAIVRSSARSRGDQAVRSLRIDDRAPSSGTTRPGGGRRLVEVVLLWSVGLVLLAGGIAAAIAADVGVGSLDVVTTALNRRTGMDIGVAIVVLNAAMVTVALVVGGRIGAATLATAVALGPAVDLWLRVFEGLPFEMAGMAAWVVLVAGVLLVGSGGAVQISSGWGPSPLDAMVVAIAGDRWTIRLVRTVVEVSYAVGGALAGGALGLGTVVMALGVGPVLSLGLRLLSPLRRRLGVELDTER